MERFRDKPPLGAEPSVELGSPFAVLAEIARGELATVYLAKRSAALGLPRLCALKRLKPALHNNPDWLELLLDEARLIAGIRHTNIVGVLGVGNDAGTFVMMEYIEGENLEALLQQAGAARHPRYVLPPFVDALNGLHALHTANDDDGNAYGIVHQAPRARHVQVGIDGTARLIDFSQMRAKAVRPTRARNDRLKVAYMAPEQALHPDGVDLRADLFIVGISLWEALTGERLFAADTDEQTFQNLLHRRIPRPSEIGLRPPRCFDAICMRALERDPKNRYASAQEMARELRDTAQQQALYATPDEMGRWVRHLIGRELRERRRVAGQEALSSSEFQLEAPASGPPLKGEPARLADGLTALPSKLDLEEDPYNTGRIYGGSYARIALEELADHDKTPAFGRRAKPLPREEEDDEPTGQHAGSGLSNVVAQHSLEARARAATVPLTEPTGLAAPAASTTGVAAPSSSLASAPAPAPASALGSGASPKPVPAPAAGASPPARAPGLEGAGGGSVLKLAREDLSSLRRERDEEQTQPGQFVPARPGARRDVLSASPGAYSQVDTSRRGARSRSTPPPRASVSPGSAAFDEEADTERRPSVAPGPTPTDGAAGGEIAGRDPGRRSFVPASPVPGARSSVPPLARGLEQRPQVITEHPPIFVQRRDSSPTRLEIPAGPIGAPHRPFAPEVVPARPRLVVPELEEAAPEPRSAAAWPDSLTPPRTAAASAAPQPSVPRSSTLWLVSGVIAAVLVLGLGMGLKHFRDRGAASSAARPAPPRHEPARSEASELAAPAPPPPPSELAQPKEEPAATSATPAAEAPALGTATKPARPKPALKPAAPPAAEQPSPESAPKRPAPRKVSALPDNPY